MMEELLQFTVEQDTVYGVLHRPAEPSATHHPAVVMLHGWSGCRLGPHRMFVKAARRLAAAGFTCLRIDFRGRGSSGGETGQATIRTMTRDALAAVDWLHANVSPDQTALLGICSGGKVAVGAAVRDPRVTRLILWSGEALAPLRSAATGARKSLYALRQYAAKALQGATWKKLLTGRTDFGLVRKALVEHESPDSREAEREAAVLDAFEDYAGELLLVYGTHDPDTRSASEGYETFCARHGIPCECHRIENANHSFYSLDAEAAVIRITANWLERKTAPATP